MSDLCQPHDIQCDVDPFEPSESEAIKLAANALKAELGVQKTNANGPVTASAVDCLRRYVQRVKNKECPQLIRQYSALDGIEIGYGLITVPACPPGKGKTALCSQIFFDALELDDKLHVVVANAEMDFESLLRRQITRATQLDSRAVRFGNLTDSELRQFEAAANELAVRLERVTYLERPYNVSQLLLLDGQPPGLLIVDYLQKFVMPDKDLRAGVGDVMSCLRTLARSGWAVIAVSATTRTKKGEELTMQHLRESSEVEYNADSIYLLNDEGPTDGKEWLRTVTLSHAKNRHDATRDIQLLFHAPRMEFMERPTILDTSPFKDDFKQCKGLNPFEVNF